MDVADSVGSASQSGKWPLPSLRQTKLGVGTWGPGRVCRPRGPDSRPVGDHDVRIAVAVQVGQCHITRSPVRAAECTGLGEVSFAVIQVDKFAIRRIVADDNVQVAVAIDVRQGRRICSVRSGAEVARGETALAIIQQHAIEERPVAALTQDDVGKAVAVEVAHVYACRGFTLFLQKQHAVKGAEDLARWGWRVASAAGREDQSEGTSCEPSHHRRRMRIASCFSV